GKLAARATLEDDVPRGHHRARIPESLLHDLPDFLLSHRIPSDQRALARLFRNVVGEAGVHRDVKLELRRLPIDELALLVVEARGQLDLRNVGEPGLRA